MFNSYCLFLERPHSCNSCVIVNYFSIFICLFCSLSLFLLYFSVLFKKNTHFADCDQKNNLLNMFQILYKITKEGTIFSMYKWKWEARAKNKLDARLSASNLCVCCAWTVWRCRWTDVRTPEIEYERDYCFGPTYLVGVKNETSLNLLFTHNRQFVVCWDTHTAKNKQTGGGRHELCCGR